MESFKINKELWNPPSGQHIGKSCPESENKAKDYAHRFKHSGQSEIQISECLNFTIVKFYH